MIAAPRAGVAAIGHEFIGAKAHLPRFLIEHGRRFHRLAPGRGRMNVHLDDARVGRHLDEIDARIEGRRIAFHMDLQLLFARHLFDRNEQFDIIIEGFHRRHENAQQTVAHFHRQRRAHGIFRRRLFQNVLPVAAATIDRHRLLHVAWIVPRRRAWVRQRPARLQRILLMSVGIDGGRHPGQRIHRQAQTDR